jgi:hypothetical protein
MTTVKVALFRRGMTNAVSRHYGQVKNALLFALLEIPSSKFLGRWTVQINAHFYKTMPGPHYLPECLYGFFTEFG